MDAEIAALTARIETTRAHGRVGTEDPEDARLRGRLGEPRVSWWPDSPSGIPSWVIPAAPLDGNRCPGQARRRGDDVNRSRCIVVTMAGNPICGHFAVKVSARHLLIQVLSPNTVCVETFGGGQLFGEQRIPR